MSKPANQSVRTTLLKGVRSHLASSISIENGYTHDLPSALIKLGTAFMPSNSKPPLIVVFEHVPRGGDEMYDVRVAGGQNDPEALMTIPIDISGWGVAGANDFPAEDTYELMADVKKALGQIDIQYIYPNNSFYGLKLVDFIYDQGIMLPANTGDGTNIPPQFVVQARIQINENCADPYRLID